MCADVALHVVDKNLTFHFFDLQVVISFQLKKFSEFNLKLLKGKDKFGGMFLFVEWRLYEAVEGTLS